MMAAGRVTEGFVQDTEKKCRTPCTSRATNTRRATTPSHLVLLDQLSTNQAMMT